MKASRIRWVWVPSSQGRVWDRRHPPPPRCQGKACCARAGVPLRRPSPTRLANTGSPNSQVALWRKQGRFPSHRGARSGRASCSPTHRPQALKHIPRHPVSGSPHRFSMAADGFCCLPPNKHLAMPAEDRQLCITPPENLTAPAKDLAYWFTLDFSFSPHFHAVPPLSQISR